MISVCKSFLCEVCPYTAGSGETWSPPVKFRGSAKISVSGEVPGRGRWGVHDSEVRLENSERVSLFTKHHTNQTSCDRLEVCTCPVPMASLGSFHWSEGRTVWSDQFLFVVFTCTSSPVHTNLCMFYSSGKQKTDSWDFRVFRLSQLSDAHGAKLHKIKLGGATKIYQRFAG